MNISRQYLDGKNEGSFCQANELIKATNFMNAVETKSFCYLLAKKKPGESKIETSLTEVAKMCGLSDNKKNLESIKSALDKFGSVRLTIGVLARDLVEFSGTVPDEQVILMRGPLMTTQLIDPSSGRIVIRINPDFQGAIEGMVRNYAWGYVNDMKHLHRSQYGPRVYQWLQMHLGTLDSFEFDWYINSESKEEPGVRQFLGIPDDVYVRPSDLCRRVVEPTLKKINESLGHKIHVEYEYLTNAGTNRIYAVRMNIFNTKKKQKIDLVHQEEAVSDGDGYPADQLAVVVIDFLNKFLREKGRLKRGFTCTPKRKKLIKHLYEAGYTDAQEYQTVIMNTFECWKESVKGQHIRPETLFKDVESFENYLNMGSGNSSELLPQWMVDAEEDRRRREQSSYEWERLGYKSEDEWAQRLAEWNDITKNES